MPSSLHFLAFAITDADLLLHRCSTPSTADFLASASTLHQMAVSCTTFLQASDEAFFTAVSTNTSLPTFIDTFLRFCPKSSLPPVNPSKDSAKSAAEKALRRVYDRLARRCLGLLRRLSFPGLGVSVPDHSHLLHNTFAFDATNLLEICTAFGDANLDVVTELVSNLFRAQPPLQHQVSNLVESSVSLLHRLTNEVLLPQSSRPHQTSLHTLLDAVAALRRFGLVYSPSISVFLDKGVLPALAAVFDVAVPVLSHLLANSDVDSVLGEVVALSEMVLEDSVFAVSDVDSLATVLPQMALAVETVDVSYEYDQVVKRAGLIRCLEAKMGLLDRLNAARRTTDVDETQLAYVEDVLTEAIASTKQTNEAESMREAITSTQKQQSDEAVKSLQELFEDFSDEYARACLRAFRFDFEATVNAVVDQKLPKALAQVKNKVWQDASAVATRKEKAAPRQDNKPAPISGVVLEEYAKLTGRITLDEARRREEERIRKEESVLVPDAHEIQMLRDGMVLDGYDDDVDDSFEDSVRFTPVEGDAESDDALGMPKNLNRVSVVAAENSSGDEEEEEKEKDVGDEATAANRPASRGSGDRMRGRGRGRGRGGGRGGSGHETEPRSYVRDERHKAQKANHNRKKKAAQKKATLG